MSIFVFSPQDITESGHSVISEGHIIALLGHVCLQIAYLVLEMENVMPLRRMSLAIKEPAMGWKEDAGPAAPWLHDAEQSLWAPVTPDTQLSVQHCGF